MVGVGDQGRCWTAARSPCLMILALFAISLLTSCNYTTLGGGGSVAPADIDVLDKVRSLDISPRQTQQVGATQNSGGQRGGSAVFAGTEIAEIGDVPAARHANGGSYDLNFENTPIATVAKVVLGDILNTGYVID